MKSYFGTLRGSETGHSLESRYALARLFRKLCCNLLPIRSSDCSLIGYGIYPSLFMFRQSCEPNCAVLFNDSIAYVVALQDIQEGEELTVCRIE